MTASTKKSDWPRSDKAVFMAMNCENIKFYGGGAVDGGGLVYYVNAKIVSGGRPNKIIYFGNCKNVEVNGITLQNSTNWTLHFSQCDNVVTDGVKVRNRDNDYGYCNDGIDIVDSRHVVVKNCDIMTGDDGIVVKSIGDYYQSEARETYDILVENCVVASTANAIKIGGETKNDMYNVTFRNITVNKYVPESGYAAIAVESNHGGEVHDILCENFTINYCDTPIFIELQHDKDSQFAKPNAGKLYNITMKNIDCLYSMRASQINTQEGLTISNVTFDNVSIHNSEKYKGNVSPKYLTGDYPEAWSYGRMPSYGLFARNVEGLSIKGNVVFNDGGNSGRPMITLQNVTQLKTNPVIERLCMIAEI